MPATSRKRTHRSTVWRGGPTRRPLKEAINAYPTAVLAWRRNSLKKTRPKTARALTGSSTINGDSGIPGGGVSGGAPTETDAKWATGEEPLITKMSLRTDTTVPATGETVKVSV